MAIEITRDWKSSDKWEYLEEEFDATHCTWKLLVNNENLCFYRAAQENGLLGSYDQIEGPFYIVAEWFASNWWNLLYEYKNDREDYLLRHLLSSNSQGYVLPDLLFERNGNQIAIKSYNGLESSNPDSPKFYFSEAQFVDIEEFKSFIKAKVLDPTLKKLKSKGVKDSYVAQVLDYRESLNEQEEEIHCLAASAGLNPLDMDEAIRAKLFGLREKLSFEQLSELLPALGIEGVLNFMRVFSKWKASKAQNSILREVSKELKPKGANPWERGYSMAESFRKVLNIETIIDFRANNLNFTPRKNLPDTIKSFTILRNDIYPEINVRKTKSKEGMRFAFARGIYDFLTTDYNGKIKGISTDTPSQQQKENNAFAAELLAPKEYLRERIDKFSKSSLSLGDVYDIAVELEVSPEAVNWQVKNHGLAEIID